jgi:hypothetical protein
MLPILNLDYVMYELKGPMTSLFKTHLRLVPNSPLPLVSLVPLNLQFQRRVQRAIVIV